MASTAQGSPFKSTQLKIDKERNHLKVLDRISKRWIKENELGWHAANNNCQDFAWYVLRQLLQRDADNVHLDVNHSVKRAYKEALMQKSCIVLKHDLLHKVPGDMFARGFSAAARSSSEWVRNLNKKIMGIPTAIYLRDWKQQLSPHLPTNARITRLWVKWNVAGALASLATDPVRVVQDANRRAQVLDHITKERR